MGVELIAVGAREDVLRKIRTSIGAPAVSSPAIEAEWNALPREYNRVGSLSREAVLEMLDERLRDYDASVIRIQSGAVAETIAKQLTERGKHRLVIPQGLAEALGEALPTGFEFVVDEGLSTTELDSFEGVVTASTVAIAETGTIVLQNVAGEGRRAPTLVPDYHLCIVRASDVVENVPEAMARLAATASLATTFVSGPSATADIEMTRIKGVHGPRFLDVILVT
jgi:L-lactate dehydrogenase complex protein LldG